MKALKILVISMGLLIVVGIALVGYGLTRGAPPRPVATPGTAETGVFAARYPVPNGKKLDQVTGAGDRLVLRFSGPDGDELVFLDSRTGQLAGTVTLTPDGK